MTKENISEHFPVSENKELNCRIKIGDNMWCKYDKD